MLTLYDAKRCPYCARVRIVLAAKRIDFETVEIDLSDRPAWLYEKNATGRVPVLEEAGFVLPESAVIMEYLEDRWPDPPLWPNDLAVRAAARLLVYRFDRLGDPYYALRRGDKRARDALENALGDLDGVLDRQPFLTGGLFGIADAAYLPWIIRVPAVTGVELDAHPTLSAWLERCAERPSVAAEVELVSALTR